MCGMSTSSILLSPFGDVRVYILHLFRPLFGSLHSCKVLEDMEGSTSVAKRKEGYEERSRAGRASRWKREWGQLYGV